MKIVVCLDDRDGMLFNRRRQSKDSALRKRVLERAEKLWMNCYSAAQFSDVPDRIVIDENFLDKAGQQDWCFLENTDISAYAQRVSGVILYRWNREYPRDMTFPTELFSHRWTLVHRADFPGNSHQMITEEIYEIQR